MADELPDLLTMAETSLVTRVGRTKLYAMAREWRATGGRSGLPVVGIGHSLRVPRLALEEMMGTKLTAASLRDASGTATRDGTDEHDVEPRTRDQSEAAQDAPNPAPPALQRRSSRRPKRRNPDQLGLFGSEATGDESDDA